MVLACLAFAVSISVQAQNDRKVNRQGVKSYDQGNFSEAEVQFRKAGDINHESFESLYNTGAALYGQEKYEETFKQYETLVEKAEDTETMAHVWHNMGNSLLETQKYGESIEAFKNSLRLNPGDQDTRYNLAYAKQKLEEQQQQDQDQQDQDQQDQDQQDQDQQDQDQQDQDQQDQDQQDQDQQDQDQQDQDQQDQDQQDQEQQDQDQQDQEQQSQPLQISREDAQRMLDAIQQQEKDVKDKVDKKKAAAAKVKTEKDW
ncbi:MAG: tetratricopeptide repeat protein [Bacteroidetes bacterium]|nr:tetratricopeptide repeat protein [Bacteroidota bacterium]